MSDVSLSKAVRSNLLHLQNTAQMMDRTQERLATGKKVNSALDNPTNFFTAAALNARSKDLSLLMDAISNSVQTLVMADKGITSITKLVEAAQATARQALQTTPRAEVTTVTVNQEASAPGDVDVGSDIAALVTGAEIADGEDPATDLVSDGQVFTVTVNGQSFSIEFYDGDGGSGSASGDADFAIDFESMDIDDLVAAINGALTGAGGDFANLTFQENGDGDLQLSSSDAADVIGISGDAAGLGFANGTYQPTNAHIGALSGTLTVGGNTLTFGAGNITNRAQLEAALAAMTGNVTGAVGSDGFLSFTGTNGATFTVGGTLDVETAFGIAEQPYLADTTSTTADDINPKRRELIAQYNELIGQISDLTKDAHYNGVNLLNGGNLEVLFNEDGTSKLVIQGVTFNAEGLGLRELDPTDFDLNVDIEAVLENLKGALGELRTQASRFGSNLTVVEARQNFTKEMRNTLETGAANLTLADTNEEAANMLALQTRQQLSQTALSLASQADQAVLRLFG